MIGIYNKERGCTTYSKDAINKIKNASYVTFIKNLGNISFIKNVDTCIYNTHDDCLELFNGIEKLFTIKDYKIDNRITIRDIAKDKSFTFTV